jgi:tyrosine-protein kinase Etk/Wzc
MILVAVAVSVGFTLHLLSREVRLYAASALIRLTDQSALVGPVGEVAPQTVVLKTDPIKSQLMVLQGRGVLGEVVDREQLRLMDAVEFAWPDYLTGVRVTTPPGSSQLIRLSFGPDKYTARTKDTTAVAVYGAPVDVGGVQFSVPKPLGVPSASLIVLPRESAIDQLAASLSASSRHETDAIDVRVTTRDSLLSQGLVNAVIETFQTVNSRTARQRATRRREFLENQLQEKDSLLTVAQDALGRFLIQQQIYGDQNRSSGAQSNMVQVEMRREELASERRAYESLLAALNNQDANTDAVEAFSSVTTGAASPIITQLQQQLSEYRATRDSLTASQWGRAPTAPMVVRLDALVVTTRERLVRAARNHMAGLDARLAALDELKARNIAEMRRMPAIEAREARLQQQVVTIKNIGDQLRAEHQKARITEAVAAGQVEIVNFASRSIPVGSDPRMKLMLGLVAGLLVGSGGALMREHLDTSIRRREDIEPVLRVPGLAVIPRISSPRRRWLPNPVWSGLGKRRDAEQEAARRPRSAGAEAYRALRTNLVFSQAVDSLHTLVVTSATEGEGKTTTAANLAITFAQQGRRVALIDCDFRRPRLASAFKVDGEPGLSDVLLGHCDVDQTLRPVGGPRVDGLDLLPSGKHPSNPSELLGSKEMGLLMADLSARYDMLILDTPPLLATSDAAVLGTKCDGVVLVVRAGHTDRSAAQLAVHQLATVRARVIGAVLNDPKSKAVGNNYYSYYSNH